MLNSLKNFFKEPDDEANTVDSDIHILCGLMIEAANIDGILEQSEIDKIHQILVETFNEDSASVEIQIKNCLSELNDHKSLHFFTSKINKSFTNEKKLILIEKLWEIILEDGKIHDFESNLIRRLAGLLYISDFECGKARKKVLAKLNIKE